MSNQEQMMTEEEQRNWIREQFQKANAYLVEKGIMTDRILTKESRYLVPYIAVWKFSVQGTTEKAWAISGDVPTDHISANGAKDARDALRYFCYRWQYKAEQIMQNEEANETEKEFASLLVKNAEKFYPLTEDDKLWGGDS